MTRKEGILIAAGTFGALYLWKQKSGGSSPLSKLLKKAPAAPAAIRSSGTQPSSALVAGRTTAQPPAATGAGAQIGAIETGFGSVLAGIAKLFPNLTKPSTGPSTAPAKSSPTSGPSGSGGSSSGQSSTQNGSPWGGGIFSGPSTVGTTDGSRAGGGLQSFDTVGSYDSADVGAQVDDPSGGTGVGPGMAAYRDSGPGLDEDGREDISGPAVETEVAPLDSTITVPTDSTGDFVDYTGGAGFIAPADDGATGGGGGGDTYEYGPDSGLDGDGE